MNNDWSFHPGIGLGRLKFGMTPEEVQTFEGIYGKVKRERKTTLPSEDEQRKWREIIEKQEQSTKKKLEERNKTLTEFRAKKSVQYLEKSLIISYYEQEFYFISAPRFCIEFNINGISVFSSEPEAVVLALADLLKENPLINGSDLVFRESLVYVFGFTYGVSKNGKPLYYTLEGTERDNEDTDFRARGISWGTLPRNVNPEDWSRHVKVKLF